MSEARYLIGDVFDRLAEIPDGSIDLIVTSPPFLPLRSYLPADHPDKGKEIGSEATPADFLSTLIALTLEWRRVLAPHGSLCVELGDTYSGSGGAGGDYAADGLREGQAKFDGSAERLRTRKRTDGGQYANHQGAETKYNDAVDRPVKGSTGWPLDKSLCLLPTLYPASLAYGRNLLDPAAEPFAPWRIRNLIVWHRPNPPVGALGDKVRPSTSYVTVACTSRTRWFDLDAERTDHKADPARYSGNGYSKGNPEGIPGNESMPGNPAGAPPLDCWLDPDPDDLDGNNVWVLSTQPYKGAHYATFPITLPRKLINLMCPRQVCVECGEPRRRIVGAQRGADPNRPEPYTVALQEQGMRNGWGTRTTGSETTYTTLGWTDCGCFVGFENNAIQSPKSHWRRGVVLDPFAGSGTTLVAASELGRDSIGIDLDSRNLDLARDRLGMFLVEDETAVAS